MALLFRQRVGRFFILDSVAKLGRAACPEKGC